jgi:tetratricopeptide (TPR) repeat protein
LVAAIADKLWLSGRRGLRIGGLAILCLVVLYYGVQQVRLNVASRSAVGYWKYVLRLNPSSEIASVELGKAYLTGGQEAQALGFLFSPGITQLHRSCLAMSRHYGTRGSPLASAIHLGMAGQREDGLQFQDYEMRAAELFYAAGAPDHAEAALGRNLIANPFNIAAMERLAEVWLLKGYVVAAGRLTDRALEIAPSQPEVGRMRTMLEARQTGLAIANASQVLHPPEPGWLRYVLQTIRDPGLREAIVQLSERHPSDPVVQMEAGICLVRTGQYHRALSKLDFVTESLPSYAYAWAMKCWAAAEAGAYEEAEEAGQRAQELDPGSSIVHSVLGILFSAQAGDPRDSTYRRKLDRAIQHYQQALQLEPGYAIAHNNLGNLLAKQGRLDEAVEHYRQALRNRPDYAEAHNNLGIVLAQQGEFEETINHFQRALRSRPDFAEAHNNLGIALARQGRAEQAIDHFQQALRIKPDHAEAHSNLGIALAQQGKTEQAIDHLQQALRIKPDYTKAWNSLVIVLMGQHRFSEVIGIFRERLARAPDNLGVALKLAWLLATCPEPNLRNGPEAVRLAQRIYQAARYSTPRNLDVLAAAYAEAGRFDEAIQTAQQALQIAVSSGQAELGRRIEERLRLYKTHRSYHK